MKVIITGVAGYLGSATAYKFLDKGYQVLGIDFMKRGQGEALELLSTFKSFHFTLLDLASELDRLKEIIEYFKPDGVIHFAAYALVEESMRYPYEYIYNNTLSTLNLLEAMYRSAVKTIVFSSSAAVYGIPQRVPIKEEDPLEPINPYGASKVIGEYILKAYASVYPLRYALLRYFNPAGSIEGSRGKLREHHFAITHLVPKLMEAIRERKTFKIFGTDYPTRDGTAVRDLIHVEDLVDAHITVFEALLREEIPSGAYNIGTGRGYSVREVVETAKRIYGDFKVEEAPRRPGDPPELIADPSKLRKHTGFQVKHTLEDILRSWKD